MELEFLSIPISSHSILLQVIKLLLMSHGDNQYEYNKHFSFIDFNY